MGLGCCKEKLDKCMDNIPDMFFYRDTSVYAIQILTCSKIVFDFRINCGSFKVLTKLPWIIGEKCSKIFEGKCYELLLLRSYELRWMIIKYDIYFMYQFIQIYIYIYKSWNAHHLLCILYYIFASLYVSSLPYVCMYLYSESIDLIMFTIWCDS